MALIIIAVALTSLFFIFAVGLGIKAQQARVSTGSEGLIGELGTAASRLDPTGTVAVHGEIWKAQSATGDVIDEGVAIEIVKVAGLQLLVQPASRTPFETSAE